MKQYLQLLKENREWAEEVVKQDPQFFTRLEEIQNPDYLWIGCSDSRVPADRITATQPGQIFVHRNISNLVIPTDLNLLSVLDYAINHLNVKHIIVCGHYGCGGVKAALGNKNYGIINKWIHPIKEVYKKHESEINALEDEKSKVNRLVELNVAEQILNLAKTSIVQRAWKTNDYPYLHGWVYDLHDGVIKPVCEMSKEDPLDPIFVFEDL